MNVVSEVFVLVKHIEGKVSKIYRHYLLRYRFIRFLLLIILHVCVLSVYRTKTFEEAVCIRM